MRKLNLIVNVAAILKRGFPLEIGGGNRAFSKEWTLKSMCANFHASIPK